MSNNTFGTHLCLTTFGESHGKSIGGILDGCPSGIVLDLSKIQGALDLRKPGTSTLTSARKEKDQVEIFSGLFEGKTTGMPIGFRIENKDVKTKDYERLKEVYRPSHADYTYAQKYGIRDYRGGGRQSARETANWVVAGSIAKQILKKESLNITTEITQVGPLKKSEYPKDFLTLMSKLILETKQEGDSLGGIISCKVTNMPIGLGEPIFNKLQARLAMAMLSINAAKGFDIGSGFGGAALKGSENNDAFTKNTSGTISTQTNHSGGVQGGISNGNDLEFRVAFKAPSSILKKQKTINIHKQEVELQVRGRHDPCVLPRALPIVEAMTALVLADFYLLHKLSKA